MTYQISVSNVGPSDAQNVTVSDTLPSEITGASASATQGSCSVVGSLVRCDLGTLAAGGNATVYAMGTVSPGALDTLTNTAGITSTTPVTNTGDDTTTLYTPVSPSADLALDVASSPTVTP